MPGGESATMITTLGFDTQKQRFVGTFVGSRMAYMWVYEGTLDKTERVLTLDSEGPTMEVEGKMVPFRDVIEFKRDDHRTMTSYMLGEDGNWHLLMTQSYQRKK